MRDRGSITSAARHTTLLARYSTVRYGGTWGGMLALSLAGKGAVVLGLGATPVEWIGCVACLRYMPPCWCLHSYGAQDTWGATTTAVITRMAQASPGL